MNTQWKTLFSVAVVLALSMLTVNAATVSKKQVLNPNVKSNQGLTGSTSTVSPPRVSWSSPNWRPVSGHTGDMSEVYTSVSPTHALNRLAFYEHSDDPNHIEIWLEKLCHDQPCDPGPRDGVIHVGNKEENLRSKEILAAGDDHYITAIQVCTTNQRDVRNRKIKGARIWTARIEPGGVVNRTGYPPVGFERPNCNDNWRDKQVCVGNRVAVGLRAYYNDDSPQSNNRHYITGLELQCAFVDES
jgi:hypothetical protein